ncbi:MAG: DUF5837 family protein [Pseudanabaenales cyanobacterium]|nr:DUF5837 family protein [Pseudanabaenales cyanobacterium]
MNKKNIIPQQTQPVVRVTPGTGTELLAELSEEVLGSSTGASASWVFCNADLGQCSYDGDDVE